jgi:hypothetical protein
LSKEKVPKKKGPPGPWSFGLPSPFLENRVREPNSPASLTTGSGSTAVRDSPVFIVGLGGGHGSIASLPPCHLMLNSCRCYNVLYVRYRPKADIETSFYGDFKMDFQLIENANSYDDQQAIFIGAVIESIKEKLEDAGLKGKKLKEITGNVSFAVATLIDNSASIEFEGKEVVPLLTFLENENELIHCGGSSYTHEYVFGALDEIFE